LEKEREREKALVYIGMHASDFEAEELALDFEAALVYIGIQQVPYFEAALV
jgi:hypothetical protein